MACSLWLLSRFSPAVRFYLRLTTYVVGLLTTAAWGTLASIGFALVGKAHNTNWFVARSFYNFVGPLLGITCRVEGEENLPRPDEVGVIVGNHQVRSTLVQSEVSLSLWACSRSSTSSIVRSRRSLQQSSRLLARTVGAFFPKRCSIMSKKSLRYTPFLGQFMSLSNAVWVDRTNRKSAVAQFAKVGEVMKSKRVSIFIFPEGTRSASETPALLPFKVRPLLHLHCRICIFNPSHRRAPSI